MPNAYIHCWSWDETRVKISILGDLRSDRGIWLQVCTETKADGSPWRFYAVLNGRAYHLAFAG